MTPKFKTSTFLLITISYLFCSCNYSTEEIVDKTSNILPNGKHLVIEKINKETTSKGIFTNHNYGTSHRFTYELSINPGGIHWDGGSAEPKHIIFCKDTTYIHYLKKMNIKVAYTDSIDNQLKYNYHFEIQEFFQKHIDERYFFKILGNDYWVEAPPEDYYHAKKSCKEYLVPNDNELSLNPVTEKQVHK